jgi:hypothetical protein
LFGFIGILLALPMASIAVVLLRFLRERYEASALYAGRGPPKIMGSAGPPVPGPGPGSDGVANPRGPSGET